MRINRKKFKKKKKRKTAESKLVFSKEEVKQELIEEQENSIEEIE